VSEFFILEDDDLVKEAERWYMRSTPAPRQLVKELASRLAASIRENNRLREETSRNSYKLDELSEKLREVREMMGLKPE
jgi:hypothetical protein